MQDTENIELEIQELKGIKNLKLSLPFKKGLYAVTGENGIGKSTTFAALSKLVYRGALQNSFRNDGSSNSKITFKLNGTENVWTKTINWQRSDGNSEIFLDGFYEGSLIFGSRFSDAHTSRIGKTQKIKATDVCDADDFVIENLGKILRDNPSAYGGLKKVKSKSIAENMGFGGIPYLIEKNSKWLYHFNMSSGEFLLIGLLHFISERIKFKTKTRNHNLSLIIMDEIELALHPSAQERLAVFLNKISSDFNFCIYFATHSVQIIHNIRPARIYHLALDIAGDIEIVNPCYPAYATRCLYTADGFDFVLLVEDELAKYFVEKAIRDNNINASRLIKILPSGGWENTLNLQKDLITSKLAGTDCKVIAILDGDVQNEFNSKYGGNSKFKGQIVSFLPIQSLEKYLRKKLVDNPDAVFAKKFGDAFYSVRSLPNILADYNSRSESEKDKNGKGLFLVLKKCAEEQGISEESFKRETCSFISNFENISTLSRTLIGLCS